MFFYKFKFFHVSYCTMILQTKQSFEDSQDMSSKKICFRVWNIEKIWKIVHNICLLFSLLLFKIFPLFHWVSFSLGTTSDSYFSLCSDPFNVQTVLFYFETRKTLQIRQFKIIAAPSYKDNLYFLIILHLNCMHDERLQQLKTILSFMQ